MTLKKIGVLSAAKVCGLLYGVMGLIFGAFASFFALVGSAFSSGANPDLGLFSMLFGVGAIIILPIFYGVLGFVGTAVFVWLFNIFAGITGGIEMEFDQSPSGSLSPPGP